MKAKKKAFVEVDIVAFIIIVILLLILTYSLGYITKFTKTKYTLTETKEKMNNDLFIINLLRTKEDFTTLEETILTDLTKHDFSASTIMINSILDKAFSEKVCWQMIIKTFDKSYVLERKNSCKKMEELSLGQVNSEIKIPQGNKNIKIIFNSI
jgi:hypothetical protein